MNVQFNSKLLAESVRNKRGDLSVRDAAAQAGMSHSTFSRIENGGFPDTHNLCLICNWMGELPSRYFTSEDRGETSSVSIHLRAAADMTPEEAAAFMELIRTTYDQILKDVDESDNA